jgi:iron complex outermembrane recepter protein
MKKLMAVSAGIAVALTGGQQAFAQTDNGLQLEEIVVTAEKREVNLQKVSTSIQVKSGEELAKTGKKRIDEIMQGTPGIQAQSNATGLTFFIRGVDAQSGRPDMNTVNQVAVLIDGVAQARQEVVRGNTLDVARAEIMRGPQSTTLGANALSGAVSLVSNQPVFEYQASGSVEIGNYHKRSLEGVFNAPLSSTAALRLAYSAETRDGYISSGAGDSDLATFRGKLRWQPTADINSVTTISNQHIGGNGVQQNVLLAYGYWIPVTNTNYTAAGLSDTNGCVSSNPSIELRGSCPAKYYATGSGVSFRDRASAWDDGAPEGSFGNGPFIDTKTTIVNEQVDWDTSIGTLTIQPAVQLARFKQVEPQMGSTYMTRDASEITPTLDVHLNSKADGALTWLAGLYYSRDKTYNQLVGVVAFPGSSDMGTTCSGPVNCYTYEDDPLQVRTSKSAYANGKWSVLDNLRVVGGVRYSSDTAEATVRSANVVGDASGPYDTRLDSTGTATTLDSGSGKWSKTTYRAGLEYDVVPGTMLYSVFSTGYTPGGLSLGMGFSTTKATTLRQITAGWKSQMFDNRFQLNGELFRTTYFERDVQGVVNAYVGAASSSNCNSLGAGPGSGIGSINLGGVSNGSGGYSDYCLLVGQDSARVPQFISQGLDLDGSWLISAADRLSFTYEYLKAKYDQKPYISANSDLSASFVQTLAASYNNANINVTPAYAQALSDKLNGTLAAYVGSTPQNAPVHSVTFDYQHTFTLPGGSQLVPRLSGTYKTKYWSFGGAPGADVAAIIHDTSSSNLAWQQNYSMWDLYLGWDSADGKLGLNAYVKNATNEVVLANYTAPYVSIQAPRTVGVVFSARL